MAVVISPFRLVFGTQERPIKETFDVFPDVLSFEIHEHPEEFPAVEVMWADRRRETWFIGKNPDTGRFYPAILHARDDSARISVDDPRAVVIYVKMLWRALMLKLERAMS